MNKQNFYLSRGNSKNREHHEFSHSHYLLHDNRYSVELLHLGVKETANAKLTDPPITQRCNGARYLRYAGQVVAIFRACGLKKGPLRKPEKGLKKRLKTGEIS